MVGDFLRRLTYCLVSVALFAATQILYAQQQFLADRHAARSVSCEGCHVTKGKPEINKDEKGREACVACHGYYPEMIKRTEKPGEEVNPHDQHDGELPCTECHKGHKPGVNYCEECHGTFVFKVP